MITKVLGAVQALSASDVEDSVEGPLILLKANERQRDSGGVRSDDVGARGSLSDPKHQG